MPKSKPYAKQPVHDSGAHEWKFGEQAVTKSSWHCALSAHYPNISWKTQPRCIGNNGYSENTNKFEKHGTLQAHQSPYFKKGNILHNFSL
jgi:hypothetical protein